MIRLKGKLYDLIRANPETSFYLGYGIDWARVRTENSIFLWAIHKDGFHESAQYNPEGWEYARKGEIPFMLIDKRSGKKECFYIMADNLEIASLKIDDLEIANGGCLRYFGNLNYPEGIQIGNVDLEKFKATVWSEYQTNQIEQTLKDTGFQVVTMTDEDLQNYLKSFAESFK